MVDKQVFSPPTDTEWLGIRNKYIGASEAAAILGYSPFSSPWSVWARKTGRVTDSFDGGPMAEWGHRLEPATAAKFADETGRTVVDPGEYHIEIQGIMLATVDRFQYMPDAPGGRGNLELKAAYYDAFARWRNAVPIEHQIQIQHQMYSTGCAFSSIAVLGNGYQFKWFDVPRHDEFIDRLVTVLGEWWDKYVIPDTPPDADGHHNTGAAITAVYPNENGKTVDLLGKELQAAHEAREVLGAELKAKKKQHDEATNKLKAAIGAASAGRLADGTGYTLTDTKKGRTIRRVKKCLQD